MQVNNRTDNIERSVLYMKEMRLLRNQSMPAPEETPLGSFNFTGLPVELQRLVFRYYMDSEQVYLPFPPLIFRMKTGVHIPPSLSLSELNELGQPLYHLALDGLFFNRTLHAELRLGPENYRRGASDPETLILHSNLVSSHEGRAIFQAHVQRLDLGLNVLYRHHTPQKVADALMRFVQTCPALRKMVISEFHLPDAGKIEKQAVVDLLKKELNKVLQSQNRHLRVGVKLDSKSPYQEIGNDIQVGGSLNKLSFCGIERCPDCGSRDYDDHCYYYSDYDGPPSNFNDLLTVVQSRILRCYMDNMLSDEHNEVDISQFDELGSPLYPMVLNALFEDRTLHGYHRLESDDSVSICSNICPMISNEDIFRDNVHRMTLDVWVEASYTPQQVTGVISRTVLSCPELKVLMIDLHFHCNDKRPADEIREIVDAVGTDLPEALRKQNRSLRVGIRAAPMDVDENPYRIKARHRFHVVGTDVESTDSLEMLKTCGISGCEECEPDYVDSDSDEDDDGDGGDDIVDQ